MNVISDKTKSIILNGLKTAKTLGMENIIFDKQLIRAYLHEEAIFILHKLDEPLEFDSMAITRITQLENRLSLVGKDNEISFEIKDKQTVEGPVTFVTKLMMKNKRTDVDFRCGDPYLIKAVKVFRDPIGFVFEIDEETVEVLNKMKSAIGSDTITFMVKKGKVVCKFVDSQGDTLNHVVADNFSITPESTSELFSFSYKSKTLLPIIKQATDSGDKFPVNITTRGYLNTKLNGLGVYIGAEV